MRGGIIHRLKMSFPDLSDIHLSMPSSLSLSSSNLPNNSSKMQQEIQESSSKRVKHDGGGLRYNQGKLRFDLVPPFAQEKYVSILTSGAKKYGDRNWERGMAWTKVIASAKRHLHAIEMGEDVDPESGELHSAHAMCNLAFLTEYYKIFPQGDDRYRPPPRRIGLDIDEVVANFTKAYAKKYNIELPNSWWFDPQIMDRLGDLAKNKDFWMNIEPLFHPDELNFEPICYITHRVIPTEWTVEWLQKNKFPNAPVITVDNRDDKVKKAKEQKLDVFVDDNIETFHEMNQNGIMCYLFDAKHNQRFRVGHRRLMSIKDLHE